MKLLNKYKLPKNFRFKNLSYTYVEPKHNFTRCYTVLEAKHKNGNRLTLISSGCVKAIEDDIVTYEALAEFNNRGQTDDY